MFQRFFHLWAFFVCAFAPAPRGLAQYPEFRTDPGRANHVFSTEIDGVWDSESIFNDGLVEYSAPFSSYTRLFPRVELSPGAILWDTTTGERLLMESTGS